SGISPAGVPDDPMGASASAVALQAARPSARAPTPKAFSALRRPSSVWTSKPSPWSSRSSAGRGRVLPLYVGRPELGVRLRIWFSMVGCSLGQLVRRMPARGGLVSHARPGGFDPAVARPRAGHGAGGFDLRIVPGGPNSQGFVEPETDP